MKHLHRRDFLAQLPCALGLAGLLPLTLTANTRSARTTDEGCWLDITAPFIVEDPELGIHSEIVLTSDTFSGKTGYSDALDETEYEFWLFDAGGKGFSPDGVTKRLTVPAMHTTVIPLKDILGEGRAFAGGLKVRLRPRTRTPMHVSDLFSSGFVRWTNEHSFDNVHANPDPLQWQRPDSFFYSMPFPPLKEYECYFCVFNPYADRSFGELALHDPLGKPVKRMSYDLKGQSSLLLDLRAGTFKKSFREAIAKGPEVTKHLTDGGGTIVLTNDKGAVKSFGYMYIKREGGKRFSIDHPIHQSPFDPAPVNVPFDASGKFKAKNILYTPLVFRSKRIGGITLNSRFHLSSGAPIEEALWLNPFVTDHEGEVPWQIAADTKLLATLPQKQVEKNVIRLAGKESCMFDSGDMALSNDFSGAMSLAISPTSNHTLMKIEVRVPEWNAFAFTHFRPGLGAAHAYQKPWQREGLATDYITTGARLERSGRKTLKDEVVCVMNVEAADGNPMLEVFANSGLIASLPLGSIPGFAARHFILSELTTKRLADGYMSLRLVDQKATLLMSLVHIDYERKDIALDHGSDRFSTFQEFTCSPKPA